MPEKKRHASPKTQKREFAFFAVWLPFMLLIGAVAVSSDNQTRLELIRILWVPVAGLVGGAFGLDAYSKQIRRDQGTTSGYSDYSGGGSAYGRDTSLSNDGPPFGDDTNFPDEGKSGKDPSP